MPELMDQETKASVIELLTHMDEPVSLLLFVDDDECEACQQQRIVLEAIAELSDNLVLTIFAADDHPEQLTRYTIDKFPATIPIVREDHGIRFFGLTAGQEFTSLLETILMISTGISGLPAEVEALVQEIDQPVHIQVFVTLTCPYCPAMVHMAHQFALVNAAIRADMIEGSQFLEIVQMYQVEGVPRTVINETTVLDGAHPETILYLTILQAVDPERFQQIAAAMRDAQGLRKVSPLDEAQTYDILIVGGGPAAMSAALYAARKRLNVGLVADRVGGQLKYTAQIENYLGFPGVSGNELLERFQFHMESYPISELVGTQVTTVEELDRGFEIVTNDGRRFQTHSVIYCAGKEYRRLSVPNEERFIGRGIAFCATCDAPLYQGRVVAVVGGGNSAFTAARDLLSFASEIHMIHRRTDHQADAFLIEEVRQDPKTKFHTPYRVRSFIGDDRLSGIEIESLNGDGITFLDVDGVFLEIGLSPNTQPVKELVALNDKGEITVSPNRATSVAGFFAAGDVTDVLEKQISIAVGDGALAALSAYEYLVDSGLVSKRAGIDNEWV